MSEVRLLEEQEVTMRLSKPIPQPKPATTATADRKARTRLRLRQDAAESRLVRERSGGRCEVTFSITGLAYPTRCICRATEVHHMLGGCGTRGHGESAKPERKLHVCPSCHRDITEHKLRRIGGPVPAWTDCYQRVR